ncbi:hypothetical protein KC19_3G092600 [Ceratodon purpureus]|uniref:Transmembrane protein 184A n=1 Tax=Ceratodon purpureus TaxID=3225 RepID=A0A8T0IK14_CERPU|nr:hypothetical protein KC19_3G092600 [Ceratodon purpureus]
MCFSCFNVQVYSLMSFLALILPKNAIIFNSIIGIYEAWVIYNFLSLCLSWVGGPGEVVTSLTGKVIQPSWHLMTCCFPPIPLDGRFIRRCKQGVLQFVILKPLLVLSAFILYYNNKYEEGSFYIGGGYLYITLIYTMSYSAALWALVLFYVACRDLLTPFKALPKFILVKSVVFLTYWQGLVIFLFSEGGTIESPQEAADYQNVLIGGEMLIAAFAHLYAFPYKDYAEANIGGTETNAWQSLFHVLNLIDVVHDTMHQFAPTYHDYVLYSNDSEAGTAPKRYRTRTFVPTGQEMESARTGKSPTHVDNTSTVKEPSSESPRSKGQTRGGIIDMTGGPLINEAEFTRSYDMTPLEPAVVSHQIVDVGLKPGEVRPAQ